MNFYIVIFLMKDKLCGKFENVMSMRNEQRTAQNETWMEQI